MIAELFGSRLRAKLIGWLLTHPDERFYVRQITGILGEDSTNASRELARLARLGLLIGRREGRQVYYQADRACPIFEELRSIASKTAGVGDVLREALAPVAERIRAAFVYGSVADGRANARSDVDLLIVGDLTIEDAVAALRPAQDRLRREVNPTVYSPGEFGDKLRAGHHFLTSVLRTDRIPLIGDADELARMA